VVNVGNDAEIADIFHEVLKSECDEAMG
jgi:hypothetical protein